MDHRPSESWTGPSSPILFSPAAGLTTSSKVKMLQTPQSDHLIARDVSYRTIHAVLPGSPRSSAQQELKGPGDE